MLNFNQLKAIFIVLSLTVASLSTLKGMEGKPPAYAGEEIALVSDGKEFKLNAEVAAKFSDMIEGFLEGTERTEAKQREIQIPTGTGEKAIGELTKLIEAVQQAVSNQGEENPIMIKHHIFAKNLQPVVDKQLRLADFATLESLIKLTNYLIMPDFTNAIVSTYLNNFSTDSLTLEVLEKLLEKRNLSEKRFKDLFVKHWHLQKNGITDEWSIKDLMQMEAIEPEESLFGGLILDLSSNKLTSLDGLEDIPDIKKVTALGFEQNLLTALPESIIGNLTNLEALVLTGNKLSKLPAKIFNNLTALKSLGLGSNKLDTLPPYIFYNNDLKILDLSNNNFEALPESIFKGLTSLKELDMSGNAFQKLPEGIFKGLTSLKELDLSNNQISSLPDNIFDDLTALLDLNLKKNALTDREAILIKRSMQEANPKAAVLINEWDHKPFRL